MPLWAARLLAVNLTLVFPVTQPDSVCLCLFPRVVKEEISDDNAKLPCFNGRVVSWVSEMDGALLLDSKQRFVQRSWLV